MRPPVRGGRGGPGRGGPRSPGFAGRGRGRGGQFRDEGPPATVVGEYNIFRYALFFTEPRGRHVYARL